MELYTPRIYIPENISSDYLNFILAHETAHIRRKDNLFKFLAFLIFTLHWFNPLVWISMIMMESDMERSCDESVMSCFNEDIRRQYAMALLNFSSCQNNICVSSKSFFGRSRVKSRIKNVLTYKKERKYVAVISSAVVIFSAFCILTNGKTDNKIKNTQTDNSEESSLYVNDKIVPVDTLSQENQKAMEVFEQAKQYAQEMETRKMLEEEKLQREKAEAMDEANRRKAMEEYEQAKQYAQEAEIQESEQK